MKTLSILFMLSCAACTASDGKAKPDSSAATTAKVDSLSVHALELVREYVERDSRGERLEPNPWFDKVVTWPQDPGYDSYAVITGVSVQPVDRQGDTVRVRVIYNVVGELHAGGKADKRFFPHDTAQAVLFRVGTYPDGLSIMEPQIEQHVLLDSALTKSSLGAEDRRKIEGLRKTSP